MGGTAMLMDLLNKAVTVAMLGFVVSSMLAMGSGLTIRQIIEPLRNARLVLLALLANFVLMPLGALALKVRYEDLARRVKPVLDRISNISLILLVLLITVANIDKVLQVFGTRGILAGLLFIALGFGIGWLVVGPGTDTRRVMALGT